jgi:hypothetical protein
LNATLTDQADDEGTLDEKDEGEDEERDERRDESDKDRPDPPGSVLVTVPGSWGDIYIDGKLHGRTGAVGRIDVKPGTHTLVIRNDHALPYRRKFTVAAGESKTIEVTSLQRKPARFRISGSVSGDCTAVVDGVERGTMAGLSWTIRVRDPDKPHKLQVRCPDGTKLSRTLPPVAPGAMVPLKLDKP